MPPLLCFSPGLKPLAQRTQLVVQGLRNPVTELLEVLLGEVALRQPALGIHREQFLQLTRLEVQTFDEQVAVLRLAADRGLLCVGAALDPLDDPCQNPGVLAETGPDELAILVLAEPVDLVDLGQFLRVGLFRRS